MATTLSALDLPFEEAIAFLRQKTNVTSRDYTDVWGKANVKSFTVAGASTKALVDDFRAEVAKALEKGTSLQEFRKGFDGIVEKHGWKHTGKPGWRSRLIYETNLGSAYNAGRYAQQIQPETLAAFPYWQYMHSGALHYRPEHKGWDGITLLASDGWWATHYTPNGYGCGCRVRSLSARALKRQGKRGPDTAPPIRMVEHTIRKTGEVIEVPEGIDPGFDYNPGMEWLGGGRPQIPSNATLIGKGPPPQRQVPPKPAPPKPVPPKPTPPAGDEDLVTVIPPGQRKQGAPIPPPLPWHRQMPRAPSPLTEADLAGMPDDVADWHRGAWPHVDDVLRRAIKGKAAPRIEPPHVKGAHATWDGGIMMSRTHMAMNKAERSVVWRHEFGHFLDMQFGTRGRYAPTEIVSSNAVPGMSRTLKEWMAASERPRPADTLLARSRGNPLPREEYEAYWRRYGADGVSLDDLRALARSEADMQRMMDAVRLNDPDEFMECWITDPHTSANRLKVMVSDFVEAVSQCKMAGLEFGVGGHGVEYYAEHRAIAEGFTSGHVLEAFANWVSIRSSELQQVKVILSKMAPDATDAFEAALKEIADGRR